MREGLELACLVAWQCGIADCLELLGELAAVGADCARAATLVGAADAICDTIGMPRHPDDPRWYERTLAALRSELGADFDEIYERGKALPLADALELAEGDQQVVRALI